LAPLVDVTLTVSHRVVGISAEERPVAGALKQIGLTLRAMGVQRDDPIVKRIGSEFRTLFCGGALEGKMGSQPSDRRTDPLKSISKALRESTSGSGGSPARAAVRGLLVLWTKTIFSRLRRFF
jgi:hypothetical protein